MWDGHGEGFAALRVTQRSACEPPLCPGDLGGSWKVERALNKVRRAAWRIGKDCLKRLKQLSLGLIKKNLKGDLMIVCSCL